MGKGNYNGGSTVIGRGSGWFTFTPAPSPKKLSCSELVKIAEADALAAEKRRAEKDAKFAELNERKKKVRKRRLKSRNLGASNATSRNCSKIAEGAGEAAAEQPDSKHLAHGAKQPTSGWTDERTQMLIDLWVKGLSAPQIAARLGRTSRSAVMGKAARLGLRKK
jgi:GcrA cell cycle regulator